MAVGGQSDFAGADAFAGSMVDFTATISWFNVLHSAEMGQSEQPVDLASCATSALGSPRRLSADFQRAGESSILKDVETMRENMALRVERAED